MHLSLFQFVTVFTLVYTQIMSIIKSPVNILWKKYFLYDCNKSYIISVFAIV